MTLRLSILFALFLSCQLAIADDMTVSFGVQPVVTSVSKTFIMTWQADPSIPLTNQTFYIYSSTNYPDPIMSFTNWQQIATVAGTNQYTCPMTDPLRFFAVRAYRNGKLSEWAAGN